MSTANHGITIENTPQGDGYWVNGGKEWRPVWQTLNRQSINEYLRHIQARLSDIEMIDYAEYLDDATPMICCHFILTYGEDTRVECRGDFWLTEFAGTKILTASW